MDEQGEIKKYHGQESSSSMKKKTIQETQDGRLAPA